MDPLWSETCRSTFKYFIILIVSTYYILFISWIIKCLFIIDARCRHGDSFLVLCLWRNMHNNQLPSLPKASVCRLSSLFSWLVDPTCLSCFVVSVRGIVLVSCIRPLITVSRNCRCDHFEPQEGRITTFDVWLTVHRSSMWNKKPTICHLVLYLFLLYKLLNMFQATLCPSSGADDLVVFLPCVV